VKLALALGGGAGLGWAHIGVLRALAARDVEVVAVAGTSIGAVAAACLAGGHLDALETLARAVDRREVMRFLDVDPRRGSVLGGRTVRNRLRAVFGEARLETLAMPVALVAADLVSGREVAMTGGPVVEAILASIAIPGVFPPVRRDGMVLIDGGVVAPVPVRAARALSPAPVVAVNLQGDYQRRSATVLPPAPRAGLLRLGRAGLALLLAEHARMSLALDPPDVELRLPVGHVDERSFTQADELIEIGAAAVAAQWPAIHAAAQQSAG